VGRRGAQEGPTVQCVGMCDEWSLISPSSCVWSGADACEALGAGGGMLSLGQDSALSAQPHPELALGHGLSWVPLGES